MSNLASALLEFQADAPPIHLDATNPHFGSKFASLGGVVAAVRPALNKHGLAFSQLPTHIGGMPALRTTLMHPESGEVIEDTAPLVLSKQDPQGYGSALTYARRYALLSILGLVGDADDDANSATQKGDVNGFRESRADNVPLERALLDPASVVLHFSKNKGKTLGDLNEKQLSWYATQWEPKAEYASDQDWTLKAAAQQLLAGTAPVPAGVGAPSDDLDIPFAASWF